MKKLIFMLSVGVLLYVAACDDAPDNPGDFGLKSSFELTSLKSLTRGEEYNLKVVGECDSVFEHVQKVVVLDEFGDTVFEDDEVTPVTEEVMVKGYTTTHLYELEPIVIRWTKEMRDAGFSKDTFELSLKSNARWKVGTVESDYTYAANFYTNANGTLAGGGDGAINFCCTMFTGGSFSVYQPIFTSDSTVMYLLPLEIRGVNYKD